MKKYLNKINLDKILSELFKDNSFKRRKQIQGYRAGLLLR